MYNLTRDFWGNFDTARPLAVINPSDSEWTIEMELPGFTEQEVDVSLENNVLTISAEHAKEKNRTKFYSSFKRSWRLADDINVDEVKASLKHGVLTVSLPKKELESTKRVINLLTE